MAGADKLSLAARVQCPEEDRHKIGEFLQIGMLRRRDHLSQVVELNSAITQPDPVSVAQFLPFDVLAVSSALSRYCSSRPDEVRQQRQVGIIQKRSQ
ncbi:MAG: hypothetical protein ACRD1R_12320 [Acidobacteriota bacterium]